ncbi:PAS domain-containing protein [Amycolatopsis sp. NPDC004378]
MFDRSPIAILVLDANGNVRDANPALCRITGRSLAGLRRLTVRELAGLGEARRLLDGVAWVLHHPSATVVVPVRAARTSRHDPRNHCDPDPRLHARSRGADGQRRGGGRPRPHSPRRLLGSGYHPARGGRAAPVRRRRRQPRRSPPGWG